MALENKFGDIDGSVAAKLEKQALKHAQSVQVLSLGAKKFSLPMNGTDTIRMRRVQPYASATTPLSEGVPPSATSIRYDVVDIPLLQYGGFTPTTDVLVDLHTTPVLGDINVQNSEQAAKTMEALMWGKLRASTNVQYANGVAGLSSVVAPLAKSEQEKAVRTLQRNKAKKYTSIVSGGVKISTTPIEAAYIAFVHTDSEQAIRAMTDFVPVAKYGSMSTISEHEFGAVDNVRYISSPDLDAQANAGGTKGSNIGTSATDVYTALYCGMDAYGSLNLAGKGSFTPVVRSVGKPTDTDPLGQIGSVGWKIYCGESILNSDWIVAVKHAVVD
jgi:N4-gp56 family major capsid protein